MKKAFKIVTNNPLVKETLENEYHIEFVECSYEEILRKVTESGEQYYYS